MSPRYGYFPLRLFPSWLLPVMATSDHATHGSCYFRLWLLLTSRYGYFPLWLLPVMATPGYGYCLLPVMARVLPVMATSRYGFSHYGYFRCGYFPLRLLTVMVTSSYGYFQLWLLSAMATSRYGYFTLWLLFIIVLWIRLQRKLAIIIHYVLE